MKRGYKKQEQGITLIALVITIVLLIILAGISVNFFIHGGIIDKAKEASEKMNQAAKDEEIGLAELSNEMDILIDGVVIPDNAIEVGEVEWAGGKASITVSTETEFMIEWEKDGEENWTKVENGGKIEGLEHGDIILIRLTNDRQAGETIKVEIKDTIAPKAANIVLSSTSVKGGADFTATVTQEDIESGINVKASKWVLDTTSGDIGTDDSLYTGGTFTNTTEIIHLSANVAGTYYLHVLSVDNAGNISQSTSEAIQIVTAPPAFVGNPSVSRTANQLNATVTASDSAVTTLTYQLYVSLKGRNSWELKQTQNNIKQGTAITLVATGLSSATEYDCYVQVSNGGYTVNSTIVQSNYCSGGKECTRCDGEGEICDGSCPNGHSFTAPPGNYRCPMCGRTNGCSLSHPKKCGSCKGNGRTTCSHGNSYSHYYQTNTGRQP